jgi:hypothetical protein
MIRPIDLQNTLLAVQNSPAAARAAEPAQRLDAQAMASAFAAELVRRDEEVAPASELHGNRIDGKDGAGDQSRERRRRGKSHVPRSDFEAVVDEAAGAEEPEHIVDFTA